MKSKRAKKTDIPLEIKKKVFSRDKGFCIIYGQPGQPNAHFIRRSKGGLGIEENIITLCWSCHHEFDNGKDEKFKKYIYETAKKYLKENYKNWNEKNLIYDKWRNYEY